MNQNIIFDIKELISLLNSEVFDSNDSLNQTTENIINQLRNWLKQPSQEISKESKKTIFRLLNGIKNKQLVIELMKRLPLLFYEIYQGADTSNYQNTHSLIESIHDCLVNRYYQLFLKNSEEMSLTNQNFQTFVGKHYLFRSWSN